MGVDLDHILWAAPDLDPGSATIAVMTGVQPARGGSHPGFGTRNSLLSLGVTYLEIIAPDPAQSLDGTRGGAIAALPGPGLLTFAVRTDDLDAYAASAARLGVPTEGPVAMSRTRPDGVRLDWACLYVHHPVFGDAIPFAIDWRGSPHPSTTAPQGCTLLDLTVLQPDADELAPIYAALGIPVAVERSARPGLRATLGTPRGDIVLVSP